jgi:mannosyltransferase OCH1-like enzyme
MDEINIFHKKWNDKIIIHNDKNLISRINNSDIGKYKLNNNFLLIIWEKWGKEYFYLLNNQYYQVTDNYDFTLDKYISNIYLIDNLSSNLYIVDHILNKIYKKDNLEILGDIYYNENNLIINKINTYYYFNNKYYNISYLDNLYNIGIFYINNIKKYYFFEKKYNICYENYNFNNKYFYKKYRNKVIIKNNGIINSPILSNSDKSIEDQDILGSTLNLNYLIYITDDNLNYKIYKKIYNNEFTINNNKIQTLKDSNFDIIMKLKNNVKFFINNSSNINDLLNLIEYFTYYNLTCILFDNINNINNNVIYDNFFIIYYNNIEDVINILNKNILKCYKSNNEINILELLYSADLERGCPENGKIIYLNKDLNKNIVTSYELININKLNIYDIISLNRINIKDIWYKLNNENLDKYKYLLNFENKSKSIKIPKIMHFVWIGNNKISNLYIKYIETWINNHTDWIFCFWNDDNIPKLINQKYYDEANINAMKADILRYELLYIFGGVYVDCDFINCKNINKIIENYNGFSAYESDKYIAIGIMGFIKNDIVIENIIKNLSYNIEINRLNDMKVPELTGPIFFTKIWELYHTKDHYLFPINYFYSYSFDDKINNKKIYVTEINYAIHMWGYSWKNKNDIDNTFSIKNNCNQNSSKFNSYFPIYYFLSNIIYNKNIKNKIKYNEISNYLKNIIYFNVPDNNKLKIVHIMGLFFTGGIEKYLYYIDKYGDHEKYSYYLLYISNDTYVYDIKNIRMYSFDWNHDILNKLLKIINPSIIIDHYTIYLDNNEIIYKNINKNIILNFIHSAICYNKDITKLNISKTINLYYEENKHNSWNNINDCYYITLGSELNNNILTNKITDTEMSEYFNISIIGRIAEEKIPITFFKKLCILSRKLLTKKIKIYIYGEKDRKFNSEYVDQFEKYIKDSCIEYCNFIDPNNISTIYNNTNIVLIPSIYETGSFTCIESYFYGIPVIGRNCYGLKYLIKNEITGYLCKNDEDILNTLENININFNFNKNNILNEAIKYNIITKIKDFENIIDLVNNTNNYIKNNIVKKSVSLNNLININNENKKSAIIITSVLNYVNKPLSYFDIRSIFSLEERYNQTLETINSIKTYMPNIEIIFIECSDLDNSSEIESNIKNNVNYYYNFYDNIDIRNCVNSKFKGLGEAKLLTEAINKLIILNNNYKNIFKISGRYFINTDFDYTEFEENYNYFTNWDNSKESYCTIFYKLNYDDIFDFKNALNISVQDLYENISIESCIYKNFNKNIKYVDRMNISGCLATEGYLFTV